ncbi:c-type cytochrome [Phenylobacterium sp.]|uniref:c-type cytochrome n=1 Tax=Phenylobacterium sp. TaxID=1871053 RepID=UPI002B474D61|nr:c-type cytochrome [Phenylobacterium sp.]
MLLALAAVAALGAAGMGAGSAGERLVLADPDAPAPSGALGLFAHARGRALFHAKCAACHGGEGQGDPAAGAPDLTDHDWLYGSGKASEIETVIRHGIRAFAPKTWKLADMPAFGRARPSAGEAAPQLAPNEVSDVTEFLIALEKRPHDPAAAERGRTLYLGRGGCFDCHGADGRGDPGIGAPDLADNVWLFGHGRRDEIARSISDGRRGRCPAWADRLSSAEIREIAIYVRGLSASPAPRGSRP